MAQQTGSGEEQKRLIYFTDKANSPYSTQQPQLYLSQKALERRTKQGISITPRDLPVNAAYVSRLKQLGVKVWYTSRWFNAAVVQCNTEQLIEIQALPFVRASQNLNRIAFTNQLAQQLKPQEQVDASQLTAPDVKDYGPAYHQANMLGADKLHEAGYTGEGMTIAVFDAGFPAVNTLPAFAHLYQNNKLKGTFDFVTKQPDVYSNSSHGTSVLSTMAAKEPAKMIGTAYGANYYLFRTEDAATEHNIEEINWLIAAEYADSAGVDVINSSLGYTTFDAPSTSYTYDQLNGNTALITKAADFAAATGMLVVVSAGNEGNKPWRYISAPADADSVLTVGAVDSLGIKAPFSSFGPSADGRIKPDVVGLGYRAYVMSPNGAVVKSNGTSFSGPIVAGMVACLWQANNTKTNLEMIRLMRQIGSNASKPDNMLGYGIPNYTRLLVQTPADALILTNPVTSNELFLTIGNKWATQRSTVYVYDVTGKMLFKQALPPNQNQHVISLRPQVLKQGLYLCKVSAGTESSTIRFVKL
ncbi:S8 family serine peptidase [Pontibacter vulgaris]|uniref:S8 family serine peptidase n=1 Tax=Pontibacter vulgaris TaxID=2905679 RepID=UPI001FA72104|nr:S8 family serine peptidase [Pontibacter vulgaris]